MEHENKENCGCKLNYVIHISHRPHSFSWFTHMVNNSDDTIVKVQLNSSSKQRTDNCN